MDESSELYLLQQRFFSGQFKEVISTPVDAFEFDEALKTQYLEYVYRAKLSLGLYEEVASSLSDESVFDQAFQFFTECLQVEGQLEEFEAFIQDNSSTDIVTKLGAFYYTKTEQIDKAVSLIEDSNTEDLESLSILVLLRVYSNNLAKAVQELSNLKKIANDSIVYNLVESFVNSIQGRYQSAFYFFEEIEQQYPNFQNRLQLLVLNLQLLQIPESLELLTQLDVNDDLNGDLIANKIAYNVLNNTSAENEALVADLKAKNPNHVFLADHAEKTALFDELVAKYKQ